jgi:hypothetical protein
MALGVSQFPTRMVSGSFKVYFCPLSVAGQGGPKNCFRARGPRDWAADRGHGVTSGCWWVQGAGGGNATSSQLPKI